MMGKVMMGKVGAMSEWVRRGGRSFSPDLQMVTVALASRTRCQVLI